ncbi:unnamed protein product [Cutaneotrichosporon oleaginosum]
MIPVRLRHPRGVTTIEVDPETQGVRDLKVLIFSSTEIPPSEQEIKFGYPPKPLPDTAGRLASIPITRGEQLIVTAVRARSPKRARRPSVKELDAELSAPRPPAPAVDTARDMPLETSESVTLPGDAGYLQLRIVPDDNSCLFSAVAVVFEGGIEAAQKLRRVVADAIRDDPTTYSDVIQPRETYISKILEPNTWGGAVELAIFAQQYVPHDLGADDSYQTEIASFDVATGRCDRFGEDQHDQRFHTTVFPLSDAAVMDAARTLVQRLKAKKYYTDTANFDLRCGVCGIGLKGEKGAREHAMATGHVEFGEY